MKSALFLLSLPLTLLACGEEEKKVIKVEACSLSIDNLEGSEWLYLKEMNGQESKPDLQSRLKYYKEDGLLKAKYTVGSFSDVYVYECSKQAGIQGEEIVCKTAPDYEQWCETMAVNNKKCSLKMFKSLDDSIEDSDELKKGIESAMKNFTAAKEKGGKEFLVYQSQHNSLRNKLQGIVYARVDAEKCLFKVTDHYMTYQNGTRLEDSNPNSTNTFVKNDAGELLWDDCETPQLFDTKMAEYPENPADVQFVGTHAIGEDVHYWLLHGPVRFAEEGCTYSFDIFQNYKKTQAGLTPEKVTVDGKEELRWHFSQKFTKASTDVVMMVTKKACAGKPEAKITACNKVKIQ